MLDTVIVGGGLCGLALARALYEQGRSFALFEARPRLGGRILSVPCATAGTMLDLGPTWYWPDTQPRIAKLIAELKLANFPQHDDGTVRQLADHDKQPETAATHDLHGGARRLEGGMAKLAEALADGLPAGAIRLDQELVAVRDKGSHVELLFRQGDITRIVHARQAVLSIPPRLLEERVQFAPPLDNELREAMRATPTWMADQAKAVVGYAAPFWREAGASGNAFVSHDKVTLGEIFDACDATGEHAALGGFFALPAAFRASVPAALMPLLVSSQLAQVFGSEAEQGEQHLQDWATERHTCATLDRTPTEAHPQYGAPRLRRALWGGKLLFSGSETASTGGGYLEGALEAAARIQRTLAAADNTPDVAATDGNVACAARFEAIATTLRAGALERYRQHLNRHLAAQEKTQLTQRALLDTVEQVYSAALDELAGLPFETATIPVERGRSGLTPALLLAFGGFNAALLDEATHYNRTSCAISNFPQDHKPEADYVDTIARDLAAAWREFALNLNGVLLGKGRTDGQRARIG